MRNTNRLSYVPSYKFSAGASKYTQLTKEYQKTIEFFVLHGEYEDKEKMFLGLHQIAEYVLSGTKHFLFEEIYEHKNRRDQVSTAIFHRINKIKNGNFLEEIKEDLEFMAQESVYVAAGLAKYRNRSMKWNPSKHGNFIRYVINNVYKEMLRDFMKKESLKYNIALYEDNKLYEQSQTDTDTVKESEIERAIDQSAIGKTATAEIRKAIKEILMGIKLPSKQMEPYLAIVCRELKDV